MKSDVRRTVVYGVEDVICKEAMMKRHGKYGRSMQVSGWGLVAALVLALSGFVPQEADANGAVTVLQEGSRIKIRGDVLDNCIRIVHDALTLFVQGCMETTVNGMDAGTPFTMATGAGITGININMMAGTDDVAVDAAQMPNLTPDNIFWTFFMGSLAQNNDDIIELGTGLADGDISVLGAAIFSVWRVVVRMGAGEADMMITGTGIPGDVTAIANLTSILDGGPGAMDSVGPVASLAGNFTTPGNETIE